MDTKCFAFFRGTVLNVKSTLRSNRHAMPKSKLLRPWLVLWWIELLSGMPTPRISLTSMTSHLFVESYKANLAWLATTSKYSKSNLCWCKRHQCYLCHNWFDAFTKLKITNFENHRVIRKSLRKNSEILVHLRRSSSQSMRERCDCRPLFFGLQVCSRL